MVDHFATLNLPRALALDDAALQAAYHTASRAAEGRPSALEGINTAFETLRSPAPRLKHLLQLTGNAGWQPVPMPDELMALFGALGPALQRAQSHAAACRDARSALAKALQATRTLREQEALAGLAQRTQTAIDERSRQFAGIDTALQSSVMAPDLWQRLRELQAHLAYLQKWQTQVQEAQFALAQCL